MKQAVSDQPSAISGARSPIGERFANDPFESPGTRRGVAAWLRLVASCIVNLVVAVLWAAILAWLTGRVLTDRFAWSQWLWWIPTPAMIIVAVLGLLFANRTARTLRRRSRRVVAWSVCTLALTIHFAFIEHRMLRSAPPLSSTSEALTIAHWNMTLDNYSPVDLLMQRVAELDAEVMVITAPPGEVRRRLCEQADASEGREHVYNAWPLFVYSRAPITRVRVLVAADFTFTTCLELDATKTLGRPIALDIVDLPSNPRLPRMAIAREARRLLDETTAPPPDIVVGDFNIPRGSASIAALFPGMLDAFDIAGHGYGATFPRRLPLYHIDHVLVNEGVGLTAVRYDIIDEGLSRHRAQKAWIQARAK